MDEPRIIINGIELGTGQAMTIRVAIENFAMDLQGESEYGAIGLAYLERISEIRAMIFKK